MYRTFIRSCRNWEEFATADKTHNESGLTLAEARERCKEFNDNRDEAEREAGTKMEFEEK